MIVKVNLYETSKMYVSTYSSFVFKNDDGMIVQNCLADLNNNMYMLFSISLN